MLPRPDALPIWTALAADVSTSAALQEPPMSRAPSLFISHGSPMFSIEPGELGPNLRQLGRTLADLSAIVVVSPHWQTQGVRVGATARSEEHTSELQSLMRISYAVLCLKK